jgi:hypothetical protein
MFLSLSGGKSGGGSFILELEGGYGGGRSRVRPYPSHVVSLRVGMRATNEAKDFRLRAVSLMSLRHPPKTDTTPFTKSLVENESNIATKTAIKTTLPRVKPPAAVNGRSR